MAEGFRPGRGPSLDGEGVQVPLGQQPPVSLPPRRDVNPRNGWRVPELHVLHDGPHD